MDADLPIRPYCKTTCFPATRIAKNTWTLETGIRMGRESAYGEVFHACRANNCHYVLKCIELGPNQNISVFNNEVTLQNECAKYGLCMPVEDSWHCHDGRGGAIITGLLEQSLGDWLKNTPNVSEKWNIIKQALMLIAKLHIQADLTHGDVHLGNFMADRNGKLLFIDMGKGSRLNNQNIAERLDQITGEYYSFLIFMGARWNDFWGVITDFVRAEIQKIPDIYDAEKSRGQSGTDREQNILLLKDIERRVLKKIWIADISEEIIKTQPAVDKIYLAARKAAEKASEKAAEKAKEDISRKFPLDFPSFDETHRERFDRYIQEFLYPKETTTSGLNRRLDALKNM
uniref:Protein kinase domain-containing protein n=1 Tax=Marseillevirus LCMAC101 TaxID=2506602 RepID=A0A481YQQ2_9VIRU|nr:MAG: hypothetical protein LCMAC101_01280 [Marseillevirus LCMAC101]